MRSKSLKSLLSVLLVSLFILSLIVSVVVAKPVGRNPGTSWPSGTFWGTNLRFENGIYVGQAWFGTRATELKINAPPDPPDGLAAEFYDNVPASKYSIWVKVPADHENWAVRLRTIGAAPSSGTLSSTMENADNLFVPQDFSVVLENTDLSLRVNLRKENIFIESLPLLATLYVDNAVNIENIENLDPLSGNPGDTLHLNVFVKNTGRYTDNYTVSAGGSLDPTILDLAPGSTDNVILTTTYPAGVENIVVTAAGDYATDQSYVTVTGMRYAVEVSISPENLIGLRGQELTYAVTVWNRGTVENSFTLENHDASGWQLVLDNAAFDNVSPGDNRTTTLHVTIPDNAIPGTRDNISIKAAYTPDNSVNAENTCTASLALVAFTVSISPSYQGKVLGGIITYTITVVNTTTDNLDFKDNYNLSISDNSGWSPLLSENRIENLGRGSQDNSVVITVTVPDNANLEDQDLITVVATSQADNSAIENASCIAQAKYRVSVSVSPSFKEGSRGDNLTYTVMVKNWGDNVDNYILTESDDALPSWAPMLDDQSFLNVQPGESRTTTLRVKIQYTSPPGTLDNIMVQATLEENSSILAENSCVAHSILLVQKIYPTADAFVAENAPNNNFNGGYLYAGRGWIDNLPVRSFLKFDLSAIPGGSTIENTLLNLTTAEYTSSIAPPIHGVFGGGENVQAHSVDNDNWNETTITWNNAPWASVGNTLDTKPVTSTDTLYSWEVTNFVAQEFGGNDEASFCMIGAGENSAPEHWARFWSNDTINPPQSYLLVSYAPGPHSVLVSISPSENTFRDNANYLVTVQNVGFENSSYTLENLDVLGFPLRLDNNHFDNIPPGENRITTLTVTIDNSITTGTIDEITVKATSIENENVIGSAQCKAEAKIRGARITIVVPAPTERAAKPGENDNFPVIVTNIDNFTDSYIFSLSDNSGWDSIISPATLTVTGEASENATLSVLIPDNSFTGMEDNIQIVATSMTDNTVSAETSCVAKTSNFLRRVTVSISPSNQENGAGENLSFTVTVNNTGNVRDNFLLTTSDTKNWGLSLSAPWIGWIDPGASENVVLMVSIPDNALESTLDNITVRAASAENENIYSESSCSATALKAAGSVEVTISPSERTGAPGEKLSFTVTIRNTGVADDNFDLTVSDDAGWGAILSASTAAISAGGSHNVTASVTVPSDAVKGESTVITVTVTGTGYENSATCTAMAGTKSGGSLLLIIVIAVIVIAIGAGVTIAVLLIKGVIRLHSSARVGAH